MAQEITVDIDVREPQWLDRLPHIETTITTLCHHVCTYCAVPAGTVEISIVLTNDEDVQELNSHYRGKDKPTNVLSFPATEDPYTKERYLLLGDVVIAYGVIDGEAKEQSKAIEAHLAHMVIHGVLHLLGYDHESPADAQQMEEKEVALLAQFGYDNPYH